MMYKMMKWWGGKPSSIWSEYIQQYSQRGDIVLDPFCGRGVGVIESVRLGRKAIGIDLNPMAIFQCKMISGTLNIEEFEKTWTKVKNDLFNIERKSGLFHTTCVKCGKSARLGTLNRDNGNPYALYYYCTCENKALQIGRAHV